MEIGAPILGIWAHPDDETFLSAGLMADAVRRGERVVCVTATKGELGIQDVTRWPAERLAEIRVQELRRSLEILGVSDHRWLDHADGACAAADVDEAVSTLCAIIEEVQPATVLTFGPDGMTAHPDHIAVSEWATLAFERCAPAGARLFYATKTDGWWETYAEMMQLDRIVMTADWEPPTVPDAQAEISFYVPDDLFELKNRSLLAQESQIGAMLSALPEEHVWEVNRFEFFRLARER